MFITHLTIIELITKYVTHCITALAILGSFLVKFHRSEQSGRIRDVRWNGKEKYPCLGDRERQNTEWLIHGQKQKKSWRIFSHFTAFALGIFSDPLSRLQ